MKKKKVLKSLLMLVMVFAVMLCMPVTSEAKAKSAKSMLNDAVKKLNKSPSISYSYDRVQNIKDEDTNYRTGVCVSDNKIDYGVYVDDSESDKGWIEYGYKNVSYRKSFNSSGYEKIVWTDSDTRSEKVYLKYVLSNLKNIKLTSTSVSNYTITGTISSKVSSDWKKATITINRKSGRITKVRFNLRKRTRYYGNGGNAYVVTGGTTTYSNICYGDSTLSLPSELRGK